MKKQFIYYLVALFTIAGVITSCINDDNVDMENASITMTFSTRANLQMGDGDSQLADNEEMKTLRVIVARQNGDVVYNIKTEVQKGETSKTFIFDELTVKAEGENFDFYAIANEDGLHFHEDLGFTLDNIITDEQLRKLRCSILGQFPQEDESIPQTLWSTQTVTPSANDNFSMELQFTVVKLTLELINDTTFPQTITDIKWKNTNAENTSLFPSQSLPENKKEDIVMPDITIPSAETLVKSVYVFENQMTSSFPYSFSAQWEGERTIDLSKDITKLSRGSELCIKVHLLNTAVEFGYQVRDWTKVSINLPEYN